MVVIYCYMERENYMVLKFHRFNFEIMASLFNTPPSSKRHTLKLQN